MTTGGAQMVLLQQAQWFKNHGCDVTAAFFYDLDGVFETWSRQYSVPLVNLNAWKKKAPVWQKIWLLIAGIFRLINLLRTEKFSAIETFTHHSNLIGIPLAWIMRVPVRVATHHGSLEIFPGLLNHLHNWIINSGKAQTLVVVSTSLKEKAIREGIQPKRIQVIANGIELPPRLEAAAATVRKELSPAQNQPLLLAVGRLVTPKGHTYLLQAVPALLTEYPDLQLVIAGEGYLRPALEAEIDSLHLERSVHLLGNRSDVPVLLQACDIFVLSSRNEGMPIALLEAMAAGAAVISTRVEGVADLICEGQNGLLVPVEDPVALAQAILHLLRNPDLRRQLGAAARETIQEKYSLDHSCRQYAAILTPDLMNSPANPIIPRVTLP